MGLKSEDPEAAPLRFKGEGPRDLSVVHPRPVWWFVPLTSTKILKV